jgi:hypothetical protein
MDICVVGIRVWGLLRL